MFRKLKTVIWQLSPDLTVRLFTRTPKHANRREPSFISPTQRHSPQIPRLRIAEWCSESILGRCLTFFLEPCHLYLSDFIFFSMVFLSRFPWPLSSAVPFTFVSSTVFSIVFWSNSCEIKGWCVSSDRKSPLRFNHSFRIEFEKEI